MFTTKKRYVSAAGKAAVLSVLLGSAAFAQGTTTNEVIVPEAAKNSEPDKGAVVQSDYPIPEQLDNNEAVIDSLIEQGFSDIHILRKAAVMTVTATRDGQPIELVYNTSSGRLVSVDGEELDPTVVDDSGGGAVADAGTDDGADDGMDDGTDDGADDGTDDGADDGTDDGDGSTGDDGDSGDGSTGDDGSDGGDTGSSDGGDDGSDTGSGDGDAGDGSDSGGSDSGGSDSGGSDSGGSDSDGSDSDGSDSGGSDSDGA